MRWHRPAAAAALSIAVAGLAGGVAVGASTGALPLAGGGDDGPGPAAPATASHTPGSETTSARHGPPASDPAPNGQGPDVTGPARFGLCQAESSGQGGTNGGKLDSVAFQALATAAGGAGNVAAYCADTTPGGNAMHGAGTANDHAGPTSDAHGPPANPGTNGQGHRP